MKHPFRIGTRIQDPDYGKGTIIGLGKPMSTGEPVALIDWDNIGRQTASMAFCERIKK